MNRSDFIFKYADDNIRAAAGTGLFPSVMIAQQILESSDGNSLLASEYNNFFGIKANSTWKGEKVNLQTSEFDNGNEYEIDDFFRVYETPLDSIKDHVKFLIENPRYKDAGVLNSKDYKEQSTRLKMAGYATDPDYDKKLISIIEKYNLSYYDTVSAGFSQHTKYLILFFILTAIIAVIIYKLNN